MKTTRIDIEGDAGTLTIQRDRAAGEVRVDSMIRNPKPREEAWKTWAFPPNAKADDLYAIAAQAQERTDGHRGTNSMVHDYLRELRRVAD